MNLLLRLSHASTAFDDSGNLMHDTSLFFVFAIVGREAHPPRTLFGVPVVFFRNYWHAKAATV